MFKLTIPAGHNAGACVNGDVGNRFGATGSVLVFAADNTNGTRSSYAVSCDGKSLSILPIETEGLEGAHNPTLLPADSCKANGKPRTVEVNGEVRASDGKKTTVSPLPVQEGRFPALRQVMPEAGNLPFTLTIDVKLLARLAAAIAPDGVITLLLPPAGKDGIIEKVIGVVGGSDESGSDGIGVIVPMTSDKTRIARRLAYATHRENMPNNSITFPV